ncbi:allophanate hydrolase subunit 1 [Mycolicibacterium sp. 624]|uniref:5-oxoprolinase subunit B family protein n=1 Tax=Mycolicibacterium sp. 624 TaxID=3156314 RepID=UPI003395F3C1
MRAVGDIGILVEADSTNTVRSLAKWVNEHRLRLDLRDVIPAVTTLFITGGSSTLRAIRADLDSFDASQFIALPQPSRRVVVDVRYDGPDLAGVASRVGLTCREVIEIHTGSEYVVEFFGFAPGQAFFGGLPPRLQLPRRSTPRTHVPAGALAIANGFTVIYPQNSPGGWNLIGTRVSDPLWDIGRTPPNRLDVGDIVQFRQCR